MDRIDLFRIFTQVVERASFSKAADKLNLPRSSVSAGIAELEARVGTRLLHRTTRKVAPTPDGSAFYERCLRLIADVEEAENLFRRTGSNLAGSVRIDAPGRIGRLIIGPALPEFLDLYPNIDVELTLTDRTINLIQDGADCALRVGPLNPSGFFVRPLGELNLINVASPAYLRRFGRPEAPSDLDRHQVVQYASPTTGRVEPWEWIEGREVRTRATRGRVTVNSAEAYIAVSLAGLGLIQVPAYDVATEIVAGTLVEVMPTFRARPLPISLLYPHRQDLAPRLKVFADWLAPLLKSKTHPSRSASHKDAASP